MIVTAGKKYRPPPSHLTFFIYSQHKWRMLFVFGVVLPFFPFLFWVLARCWSKHHLNILEAMYIHFLFLFLKLLQHQSWKLRDLHQTGTRERFQSGRVSSELIKQLLAASAMQDFIMRQSFYWPVKEASVEGGAVGWPTLTRELDCGPASHARSNTAVLSRSSAPLPNIWNTKAKTVVLDHAKLKRDDPFSLTWNIGLIHKKVRTGPSDLVSFWARQWWRRFLPSRSVAHRSPFCFLLRDTETVSGRF